MHHEITNPRFFPGNISGLGLQCDDNGRAVDTRYGVHPDYTDGCLIEHPTPGLITLAYAIDGTLDGTTDRVRALYLITPPMAAQMVTDLAGMLLRADPVGAAALVGRLSDLVSPPSPDPDAVEDEPEPGPTDTLVLPATSDAQAA